MTYPLSRALNHIRKNDHSDLTVRQLSILLALRKGLRTLRGLSAELAVSKPAIHRALDKLEERDWLQRIPDPADKRSVFIKLTPVGEAFTKDFS